MEHGKQPSGSHAVITAIRESCSLQNIIFGFPSPQIEERKGNRIQLRKLELPIIKERLKLYSLHIYYENENVVVFGKTQLHSEGGTSSRELSSLDEWELIIQKWKKALTVAYTQQLFPIAQGTGAMAETYITESMQLLFYQRNLHPWNLTSTVRTMVMRHPKRMYVRQGRLIVCYLSERSEL